MQQLRDIVRDPFINGESYGEGHYESLNFDQGLKTLVKELLDKVDLGDTYETICVCGCNEKVSFWDVIEYANINFDLFKWMVEDLKLFPVATNEKIRCRILYTFQQLLRNACVENRRGMPERIENLTKYMFDWLEQEIPQEICTAILHPEHADDGYHETCFEAANYSYWIHSDRYANRILDLYEKYNLKFPIGKSNNMIESTGCLQVELLKRSLKFISEKLDIKNLIAILTSCAKIRDPKDHQKIHDSLKMISNHLEDDDLTQIVELEHHQFKHAGPVKLNITDILKLYKWDYPGSIVMMAFEGYVLPEPHTHQTLEFYY